MMFEPSVLVVTKCELRADSMKHSNASEVVQTDGETICMYLQKAPSEWDARA